MLRKHFRTKLRTLEENQINNIIRRTKGKRTSIHLIINSGHQINFINFKAPKNNRRDTHESRKPFFSGNSKKPISSSVLYLITKLEGGGVGKKASVVLRLEHTTFGLGIITSTDKPRKLISDKIQPSFIWYFTYN